MNQLILGYYSDGMRDKGKVDSEILMKIFIIKRVKLRLNYEKR